MSKKQIALLVGGLTPMTLGLIGLAVFLAKFQAGTNPTNSLAARKPSSVPEIPVSDQIYTDSSGFSFKYPKDVKVTDTTPAEEIYYSRLDLDRKGNKVSIEIKDAPKEPVYQNFSGATTLGGFPAKQYKTEFTTITSSYDSGVLYVVQLHTQDTYMSKVYDNVVSSFTVGGGTGEGDTIFEEETIE